MFPDLAFVKFSVIDANNNNHVISQRVLPLKCLRPGYRHLRLRNTQNQPLELPTLFLYSKQQVEYIPSNAVNSNQNGSSSLINIQSNTGQVSTSGESSKAKHKQFKVTVYGLDEEDKENGVQVKVTQDTTVQQVIEQVTLILTV